MLRILLFKLTCVDYCWSIFSNYNANNPDIARIQRFTPYKILYMYGDLLCIRGIVMMRLF